MLQRRVEDKFDGRNLGSLLITLRMEAPPACKQVPMVHHGWVVWADSCWEDNVFRNCELVQMKSGSWIFTKFYSLAGLC